MRKTVFIFILLFFSVPLLGSDLSTFFADADSFLKKYVKNGNVAYDQIHKNPDELEKLYFAIGVMNLSDAGDSNKIAFYINAYNLIVLYSINKKFPVSSPMDIKGFFDAIKHKVAGESLTLDMLEKNKLLSVYKDPRYHFVLVCAAISCPPLADFAFMPDHLEKQLNDRTTLAINDDDWLKVDSKKKVIHVSRIFEWYTNDFTSGGKKITDWINQYRREKIPTTFRVEFYAYDWSLNGL